MVDGNDNFERSCPLYYYCYYSPSLQILIMGAQKDKEMEKRRMKKIIRAVDKEEEEGGS